MAPSPIAAPTRSRSVVLNVVSFICGALVVHKLHSSTSEIVSVQEVLPASQFRSLPGEWKGGALHDPYRIKRLYGALAYKRGTSAECTKALFQSNSSTPLEANARALARVHVPQETPPGGRILCLVYMAEKRAFDGQLKARLNRKVSPAGGSIIGSVSYPPTTLNASCKHWLCESQ